MKAMQEAQEIEKYKMLVAEMMLADEYKEDDFRPDWILKHSWKAVPVEDGNHFTDEEIAIMVPALQNAGYRDCVAVATEPLDPFPPCFQLAITPDDLREFNRECGCFVSSLRRIQGRGPSPAMSCTTCSPGSGPSWKQCSGYLLRRLERSSGRLQNRWRKGTQSIPSSKRRSTTHTFSGRRDNSLFLLTTDH